MKAALTRSLEALSDQSARESIAARVVIHDDAESAIVLPGTRDILNIDQRDIPVDAGIKRDSMGRNRIDSK